MDRELFYPGEVLPDTSLLGIAKDSMFGLAFLSQAILGTSTLFDGLACTPTSPASLQVNIAPGSCYQQAAADGTAFGSLGSDSTSIIKQGILSAVSQLTCAPPSTSGYSINYLIQATYADQDANAQTLGYYNASNPGVAFSGPGGLGATNYTVRKGVVTLIAKAGASATTGTQTTPTPDAGYVGLWVVTVAYGQTAINSGNIAYAASPPFIGEKLTQKISLATGDARYAMLTGAVAGRARQIFTSSGTYTPNAKLIYADIQIVGGGGGGAGGNSSSGSCGSGGGAGEYARGLLSAATIGASQAVTIGAAGTAGSANSNGSSGATTSFGSFIFAVGGTFGIVGSSSASQSVQGGIGGQGGTGGDYRETGGDGQCGAPAASAFGGMGAASFFGGGGAGSSSTVAARAGEAHGSGGGGGQNAGAGAAGKIGVCIIDEYLHA